MAQVGLIRRNSRGNEYLLTVCANGVRISTITRTGPREITVALTLEDLSNRWDNWQIRGRYVQDAFDNLKPHEREFLLTGVTEEEWKELFGGPER